MRGRPERMSTPLHGRTSWCHSCTWKNSDHVAPVYACNWSGRMSEAGCAAGAARLRGATPACSLSGWYGTVPDLTVVVQMLHAVTESRIYTTTTTIKCALTRTLVRRDGRDWESMVVIRGRNQNRIPRYTSIIIGTSCASVKGLLHFLALRLAFRSAWCCPSRVLLSRILILILIPRSRDGPRTKGSDSDAASAHSGRLERAKPKAIYGRSDQDTGTG